MGNEQVTTRNVEVVRVDADKNLLLIRYDPRMVDEMKSFTGKWRAAYRFARP